MLAALNTAWDSIDGTQASEAEPYSQPHEVELHCPLPRLSLFHNRWMHADVKSVSIPKSTTHNEVSFPYLIGLCLQVAFHSTFSWSYLSFIKCENIAISSVRESVSPSPARLSSLRIPSLLMRGPVQCTAGRCQHKAGTQELLGFQKPSRGSTSWRICFPKCSREAKAHYNPL